MRHAYKTAISDYKQEVAVPVRGADCVETTDPKYTRHYSVAVPVRGADCVESGFPHLWHLAWLPSP